MANLPPFISKRSPLKISFDKTNPNIKFKNKPEVHLYIFGKTTYCSTIFDLRRSQRAAAPVADL